MCALYILELIVFGVSNVVTFSSETQCAKILEHKIHKTCYVNPNRQDIYLDKKNLVQHLNNIFHTNEIIYMSVCVRTHIDLYLFLSKKIR